MVKIKKTPGRPICSGIWHWYCVVCHKRYVNQKGHVKCYKNYCRVCEISLPSDDAYKEHAMLIHFDTYCSTCNTIYPDLENHPKCGREQRKGRAKRIR